MRSLALSSYIIGKIISRIVQSRDLYINLRAESQRRRVNEGNFLGGETRALSSALDDRSPVTRLSFGALSSPIFLAVPSAPLPSAYFSVYRSSIVERNGRKAHFISPPRAQSCRPTASSRLWRGARAVGILRRIPPGTRRGGSGRSRAMPISGRRAGRLSASLRVEKELLAKDIAVRTLHSSRASLSERFMSGTIASTICRAEYV